MSGEQGTGTTLTVGELTSRHVNDDFEIGPVEGTLLAVRHDCEVMTIPMVPRGFERREAVRWTVVVVDQMGRRVENSYPADAECRSWAR